MTNPGDIERVATKVVPYYVVGIVEDEPEVETEPPESDNVGTDSYLVRRPRPTWLGFIAAALGVATLILFIVAMLIATGGNFPAGTMLSYVTIAVSIVAVITAVLCLVLGYQRRWAAFGLALAVLANPIVLVTVFRSFGS
ncbi:MAG: 1,4-dihydroxy-6-naphthoate synthase [Rhodoglobus sp.]